MSNNQITIRGKSMLAKPVVKNKFWIVENTNGDKIATIQKLNIGKSVVLVEDSVRTKYPSIKVLSEKHNIKIGSAVKKAEPAPLNDVHGYSTDCDVFNVVYDVQRGLPLYTKIEASKSFFCAGYYIISFNGSWVKNYCPKLLTLDRNDYRGPFYTMMEMKDRLEEMRK